MTPVQSGQVLKACLEARGGKKQGKGRPKKNAQNGHLTVSGISKDLGIPRQTAERHIKAAEDYEAAAPELREKVDQGEITASAGACSSHASRSVLQHGAGRSFPSGVMRRREGLVTN